MLLENRVADHGHCTCMNDIVVEMKHHTYAMTVIILNREEMSGQEGSSVGQQATTYLQSKGIETQKTSNSTSFSRRRRNKEKHEGKPATYGLQIGSKNETVEMLEEIRSV